MKAYLVLFSVLSVGCDGSVAEAAPTVAEATRTWSDGLAEVATYEAELNRYGEQRSYKEVQILVKERFDRRRMVKTDAPGSAPEHEFNVLKSARVLHFTTGIYDYHQSLNYFAPLSASKTAIGERPAKLTLASFEWCGNFFTEWLADGDALKERSFSYFDGEADSQRTLGDPGGAWLAEDGWPVWSRGLTGYGGAGDGGRTPVKVLTSTLVARFEHRPVRWVDGFLTVRRGTDKDTVTLEVGEERTWSIEVDRSEFRRILSWETTHGWGGRLIKVERRPYWGEHAEKDTHLRKELGL